jgi:DNA-binding phage protein
MMAKTKSFRDLVQSQVKTDPKFAEALLREGVDALLSGDVDSGKTILRDYIKATVGFEKLGEATGAPPKSLIRMFGPRGNPQAKNLFSVLGYLQRRAGFEMHVTLGR